ncbi:MAG: diguanylate cyclase [Telmatospirillum sp.]|nr:diguanylate cyclase [Telmatospirillum sp.]
MLPERQKLIRSLFDEYIEMYAARDDRLTSRFSKNFTGYTGGGDFLVKDVHDWVRITRQDFEQVPGRLRIELTDISLQDIDETVVAVTAFFHIHLPMPDHILSRETARLVLIFRLEGTDWMIVHSGISIPYHLVGDGEVYPIDGLRKRNRELEALVEDRTRALEQAVGQLEAQSNTDWLTGISNRRRFDSMLREEWNRARRVGAALAIVMFDIDHFKHFNDHYGHLAGDDCLKSLAQTVEQAERRAGTLFARYGGEEFVMLLPGMDLPAAMKAARHIQQAIRSRALPHHGIPPGIVTVSLGVASLTPSDRVSPEDLLREADLALYRAKESGRNRMCSANGSQASPGSRRLPF